MKKKLSKKELFDRFVALKVDRMPFGDAMLYFKRGADGKSQAERDFYEAVHMERVCSTPSVENCLHCERAECVVYMGCPLHESEIIAELNVGMIDLNALTMHRLRKARSGCV